MQKAKNKYNKLMEPFIIAILIAAAVSIDNFIISVSLGLCIKNLTNKIMIRTSAVFAAFSLILFLIGWDLGLHLEKLLHHDHYFAFAFLAFIGFKMLKSALNPKDEQIKADVILSIKSLAVFSIATSMDALIIGMTSSISSINSEYAGISIPLFIFGATFAGLKLGSHLSGKSTKIMQIIGALILIGLGVKILISG